jgi:hypothetical protein
LRAVLGFHRQSLIERRLIGPRIDLRNKRTLGNVLTFDETDFLQLSVDARGDGRAR